ncbi:MAG: hypothetical protein Q9169_007583 [Polycauliona sp. 2 TL-2023]
MNFNSILVIACLASLSSVTGATSNNGTAMTAKYDDRKASLIPSPLKEYQGIEYTNFVLAAQPDISIGVLQSQSPRNRIATNPLGTPAITPQTPSYIAFAFQDFYFGCVLRTQNALLSQPKACDVTLTGYSASTGQEVAKTTVKFTPDPALVKIAPTPTDRVVLPSSFNQKLSKVTVAVSNSLVTAALLDNLGYRLFTS